MASAKAVIEFSDGDRVVFKMKAKSSYPDVLDELRIQTARGAREACAEVFVAQDVKAEEG